MQIWLQCVVSSGCFRESPSQITWFFPPFHRSRDLSRDLWVQTFAGTCWFCVIVLYKTVYTYICQCLVLMDFRSRDSFPPFLDHVISSRHFRVHRTSCSQVCGASFSRRDKRRLRDWIQLTFKLIFKAWFSWTDIRRLYMHSWILYCARSISTDSSTGSITAESKYHNKH